MRARTISVLVAVLVLAGTLAAAAAAGGGSRHVTRKQFRSNWPLTVPPFPGAVIFTTYADKTYWLNGTAGDSASQHGWRDVHPIWAKVKHPLFPGQRKDIGVLIDAGLKLCG